jgi:hypothetical protein
MSSIKQHQETNTIRGYHDAQFLICNSCFWCASYLSYNPYYVETCPGIQVAGVVVSGVPSKAMVTVELGSKLIPVTITDVPAGPEVGLSVMLGGTITAAVVNFHSLDEVIGLPEISSTPPEPPFIVTVYDVDPDSKDVGVKV